MSPGPLPQRVNIRKAVTRNARYEGGVGPAQLGQFAAFFDASAGVQRGDGDGFWPVWLVAEFGEDEEGRQFVAVSLEARVQLQCQRCLAPVDLALSSDSRLGLVASDEQARHLPKSYEPWVALDEVDLWRIAEEELALALPVVAYHPPGECSPPGGRAAFGNKDDPAQEREDSAGEGPFTVLSSLLQGEEAKEKP